MEKILEKLQSVYPRLGIGTSTSMAVCDRMLHPLTKNLSNSKPPGQCRYLKLYTIAKVDCPAPQCSSIANSANKLHSLRELDTETSVHLDSSVLLTKLK